MKKKYSVKELASILGCSVTAVNKKIKTDINNPYIKRYRNIYETVIDTGITYILLDDNELEQEKTRSKGFNNISNNGYNTPQDEDIIDVEPQKEEETQKTLLEFTERYISNITTMQQTFYEELLRKDKQIFLLTDSESKQNAEYLETKALNKTLEKINNRLKLTLAVVITLLVTVSIVLLSFVFSNKETQEEIQPVENVIEQPVVNVTKPKVSNKKKVAIQ